MRDLTLPAAGLLRTAVSGLLRSGGPSAILRAIRTVVVDSFKRGARSGARTHVCVKLCERRTPRLANRYPAPTPILPILNITVVASLFHGLPRGPLRNNLSFSSQTMNQMGRVFQIETAATGACAISQCGASDRLYGSAGTATKPLALTGITQCRPSPKLSLRDVYERGHLLILQRSGGHSNA